MNIKKTIRNILIGATLGTTILGSAALATEQENKKESQTNISITYNSEASQSAYDTLLAEDVRMQLSHTQGDSTFSILHQNNTEQFGAGNDYTILGYTTSKDDWNAAINIKHKQKAEGSEWSTTLLANKSFGEDEQGKTKHTIGMVGVIGETFVTGGANYSSQNIDVSFNHTQYFNGEDSQNYAVGYHKGNSGLWLSKSDTGDAGFSGVVDANKLKIFTYGKNRTNDTGFAVLRAANQETSQLFTAGVGRFTSQVFAGQLPRPIPGSLGSYLAEGKNTAQIIYVDNTNTEGGESYIEAQAGTRIFSTEHLDLSLGGGIKYLDKIQPVGEAYINIATKHLNLGITTRVEQTQERLDGMLSIKTSYKW